MSLKSQNHTYLIGQNCLFQHQTDQKFPYMWAVMRTGTSQTILLWRKPTQRRNTSPMDRSCPKRKIRLDSLSVFGTIVSDRKKGQKKPALSTTREINPKNQHCLRGMDWRYDRWDEILRDILNGKLIIVQNKKRTESDTDDDDDDGDDEEMPEETGTPTVYDTSERDGRYVPIRTNPEDALQLHTDREITGENLKTQIRRSNRESKKPNRYGSIPYTGNFGGWNLNV